MRKALIPLFASLALCGAATTAMVMSSAHAQPSPRKPVMLAQADNAPPARRGGLAPGDIANRMKEMCQDQVARETARLAYLETRLQLTAAEQPLFTRWKDAVLTVARRHADQCGQRVTQRQSQRQTDAPQGQNGQTRPASPAERMTREEDQLKQRLADIQTERPAMEALYNALSPAQKTELAHAGMRARGGQMMRRSRFADARGPMRGQGMMGPGMPMGPGAMGPGGSQGRPGAPPPQR